MDTEKRRTLTVVYAAKAVKQLGEIWDWNQQRYSADHADQYLEFLEQQINALNIGYARGTQVSSRPDLLHIFIRRKSRGNGHIAVFSVDLNHVNVLYVFHSAQDWQTKLTEKLR